MYFLPGQETSKYNSQGNFKPSVLVAMGGMLRPTVIQRPRLMEASSTTYVSLLGGLYLNQPEGKEHGKARVKGCMDYSHIASVYTSMARKQGHLAAKEAGGCHIIKCPDFIWPVSICP